MKIPTATTCRAHRCSHRGSLPGHTSKSAKAAVPDLAVTTAGRALHLEGRFGSLSEIIDVTVDSVVAPKSGTGSLKYATSVAGQPCAADYKASLSIRP